jgi:transketolase
VAWARAIERRDGPAALVFTRQALPAQARTPAQVEAMSNGGYVLVDSAGPPEVVLIATGSEVQLAVGAQQALAARGRRVRVVSLPCTAVFDAMPAAYREAVLPPGVPRVAVEAGVSDYWRRYVGLEGGVVGIDRFGASAPAKDLFREFGFTVENVIRAVDAVLPTA